MGNTSILPQNRDRIIIPADDKQRRELAREGILKCSGLGAFRALLLSPYMRSGMVEKTRFYSAIDLVTILGDFTNEPRKYWEQEKRRIIGADAELSQNLGQLKLPSWSVKRSYMTDVGRQWVMEKIIHRLDTPLANLIGNQILKDRERYGDALADQIFHELEFDTGWAATRNRLDGARFGGGEGVKDSELEWWER